MSHYVVKRRTTVRVSLVGNEALDGEFCLAVDSPELRRAETLLDLLNSERRMVPFICSGDQRVSLIARANIDWVMTVESAPREWIYPPHYVVGYEEPVHITFLDGREIEGKLQVETTPAATRASDFLNGAADFFPVAIRLGTLLANKARVRGVLLIESNVAGAGPEMKPIAAELPRELG